jgi:hypothetical protein
MALRVLRSELQDRDIQVSDSTVGARVRLESRSLARLPFRKQAAP